jgi:Helix-turn-helix domain
MYLHAERLLAKAGVARRNGEGDLPPLEREPQAERKGRSEAEVCTSAARKIGETPCAARSGQRPLAYLALALQNRPETWFTAERDGYGHSGFGHARRCCMPWKEIRIVDQRLQFLSSYQKEEMSVADPCRAYGISRPTAYRSINRYNETGPEGLVDRMAPGESISILDFII